MVSKESLGSEEKKKVRVNTQINGEPAQIFLELKRRGIISNARDAVIQGLMCLHERMLARDLQRAQLKASERLNQEY